MSLMNKNCLRIVNFEHKEKNFYYLHCIFQATLDKHPKDDLLFFLVRCIIMYTDRSINLIRSDKNNDYLFK